MNRDEQKQITELIEYAVKHVSARHAKSMDIEADAIIRALFVRNPEAAYGVTMLAIAQAAQIKQLQAELAELAKAGILSRWFKSRRQCSVLASVADTESQVSSVS